MISNVVDGNITLFTFSVTMSLSSRRITDFLISAEEAANIMLYSPLSATQQLVFSLKEARSEGVISQESV